MSSLVVLSAREFRTAKCTAERGFTEAGRPHVVSCLGTVGQVVCSQRVILFVLLVSTDLGIGMTLLATEIIHTGVGSFQMDCEGVHFVRTGLRRDQRLYLMVSWSLLDAYLRVLHASYRDTNRPKCVPHRHSCSSLTPPPIVFTQRNV